MNPEVEQKKLRTDHRIITEIIPEKSVVLDLGCGNGDLLYNLVEEKKIKDEN